LFFHGWKLAQSLESLVKIKENETPILTKQGCVGIKGRHFNGQDTKIIKYHVMLEDILMWWILSFDIT
jgi:hypothetical protein